MRTGSSFVGIKKKEKDNNNKTMMGCGGATNPKVQHDPN